MNITKEAVIVGIASQNTFITGVSQVVSIIIFATYLLSGF